MSTVTTEPKKEHVPDFFAHPTRRDKLMMLGFLIMFLYGIVSMFFRFDIHHPWVMCVINGSLPGIIISGAHVKTMHSSWLIPGLLCLFGVLKFMPLWWAVGRYWGDEYIEMTFKNQSKFISRLRHLEHKNLAWKTGFLQLGHLPFSPIPTTFINLFLGNSKLSLLKTMILNILCLVWVIALFEYLGYRYGQTVVHDVNYIDSKLSFLNYLFIVFIILAIIRSQKNTQKNKQ